MCEPSLLPPAVDTRTWRLVASQELGEGSWLAVYPCRSPAHLLVVAVGCAGAVHQIVVQHGQHHLQYIATPWGGMGRGQLKPGKARGQHSLEFVCTLCAASPQAPAESRIAVVPLARPQQPDCRMPHLAAAKDD